MKNPLGRSLRARSSSRVTVWFTSGDPVSKSLFEYFISCHRILDRMTSPIWNMHINYHQTLIRNMQPFALFDSVWADFVQNTDLDIDSFGWWPTGTGRSVRIQISSKTSPFFSQFFLNKFFTIAVGNGCQDANNNSFARKSRYAWFAQPVLKWGSNIFFFCFFFPSSRRTVGIQETRPVLCKQRRPKKNPQACI